MHPFAHILLAALIAGVGPLSALAQQPLFDHDKDGGFASSLDRLQRRAALQSKDPSAPLDPGMMTNAEWCKRMRQLLADKKAALADARKDVDKANDELKAATTEIQKAQAAYDRDLHGIEAPERIELRQKLDKATDRYHSAVYEVEASYEDMREKQSWVDQVSKVLAAHEAQCKEAASPPPKQPHAPPPKPVAAPPKPVAAPTPALPKPPKEVVTYEVPAGLFKITKTYREQWDSNRKLQLVEVQVPNAIGKWVAYFYGEADRKYESIAGKDVAVVNTVDQDGKTVVATYDSAVKGPYKTNVEFCPVVQDLLNRDQFYILPAYKDAFLQGWACDR